MAGQIPIPDPPRDKLRGYFSYGPTSGLCYLFPSARLAGFLILAFGFLNGFGTAPLGTESTVLRAAMNRVPPSGPSIISVWGFMVFIFARLQVGWRTLRADSRMPETPTVRVEFAPGP